MNRLFHGVIAYDDLSIAKLAKEKWDFMVGALQPGCDFQLRVWKFEALRFPRLRDLAVNDAAQSAVIIVATKGTSEFPMEVNEWMEQWLAQKAETADHAGLLILLCDPAPEKFGAFGLSQFACLQRTARRGAMDFLSSVQTISSDPVPSQPNPVTGLPGSGEISVQHVKA